MFGLQQRGEDVWAHQHFVHDTNPNVHWKPVLITTVPYCMRISWTQKWEFLLLKTPSCINRSQDKLWEIWDLHLLFQIPSNKITAKQKIILINRLHLLQFEWMMAVAINNLPYAVVTSMNIVSNSSRAACGRVVVKLSDYLFFKLKGANPSRFTTIMNVGHKAANFPQATIDDEKCSRIRQHSV